MKKRLKGSMLLFIAAVVWGLAFPVQKNGMTYLEPFTYGSMRLLLGGICLLPIIFIFDKLKVKRKRITKDEMKSQNKISLIGGVFCGIILFVASSFQQYGLSLTTSGKAGFITALYIVIVPIIGIFVHKKFPSVVTWICIAVAVLGFYLLCVKDGFKVSIGDLLVLCCAVCFSGHIVSIDHYNQKGVDGLKLSCVQFLVAGLISLIPMFLFENPDISNILKSWDTILYGGAMSCGVAFTFQVLGQKDCEPTLATLIMCLESVFAALFGWVLLKESLSPKEFIGCVLVFVAVVFAQIPLPIKKKQKEKQKD